MSDNPVLSRREVLKLALATTVTVLIRSHLPAIVALERAQQATQLAGLLTHSASAKVIGSEYLRTYPHEADRGRLVEQIAARLDGNAVGLLDSSDQRLREQLVDMVRTDFAADRVIKLRGWVLSATEARLCALAALL